MYKMAVYFPDDDFDPRVPDDDEPLWRYIDFTQFVYIIEERSLWFSATDNFTDKWEGGLTTRQVEKISEKLPSFIKDDKESVKWLFDALRATTYVSCWHYRNEETAAMWELYNDKGKEVAIKTTVGQLREALSDSDDMKMGCVAYKKYEKGGYLFPVTRVSPFFHKRESFKHENEFRMVKSEFNLPQRASVREGLKQIVAEKSGSGRDMPISRSTLIDEVVISPVAGKWMKGLVKKVLSTHELDEEIEVRDSKLRGDPFSP